MVGAYFYTPPIPLKMKYEDIKKMYEEKGYTFLTRTYEANLFGIRNKDTKIVDEFNDVLGVAYVDGFGVCQCLTFAGTTKPGLVYLKDKLFNTSGTFIMAPGQHKGAWMCGYHHANDPEKRYESYVQRMPRVFKGWRDSDSDGAFDFTGKIYDDAVGVNGHRAGINYTGKVGLYSAGCQVVQDDKEHLIWLSVGKRHAELYGNSLTYTLFQAV